MLRALGAGEGWAEGARGWEDAGVGTWMSQSGKSFWKVPAGNLSTEVALVVLVPGGR